MNPFTSTSQAI